jgi:hypothetical protein
MKGALIQAAASLRRWRGSQTDIAAGHAGERPVRAPVDLRPAGPSSGVPCRHDRIQHDFFTLESTGGGSVAEDANQNAARVEAPASRPRQADGREGPRLKAILIGCQPKAVINDKIVTVGEKLKLIAGGPNDDEFDEFEVTAIDGDGVRLTKRGGQVVVLRLEPEDDGQPGGAMESQ